MDYNISELINYWKQYKQDCINWLPSSPQAEKLRIEQIDMVEKTIEVLTRSQTSGKALVSDFDTLSSKTTL